MKYRNVDVYLRADVDGTMGLTHNMGGFETNAHEFRTDLGDFLIELGNAFKEERAND